MTERYAVSRVIGSELVRVGTLLRSVRGQERFSYAGSYLERGEAPLSLSLPLRSEDYAANDIRPYFDGLLPEGPTRTAIVARLQVPETDWLAILGSSGLDCIGDVVVEPEDPEAPDVRRWNQGAYVPLGSRELCDVVSDLSTLAKSSEESRLSLAGNQGKVGLAHVPDTSLYDDWLRPIGGAASTHILKVSDMPRIAEFEIVCMGAASRCGLRVAEIRALQFGKPVACVQRFDRNVAYDGVDLRVERLHQEDLAQAFALSSQSKYLELEGGTYAAIARLLRRRSSDPLTDIDQLARIAVFDYLVGNCDNHLKNLSVLHGSGTLRLSPAYDIVCTTFFEKFTRDMGWRLGSTRSIDLVCPYDFLTLSKEIGLGVRRMRRICSELAEAVPEALMWAAERDASVLETLPYSAEDVIDDMPSRRKVVAAFARGAD